MASIQDSPYPLVFPLDLVPPAFMAPPSDMAAGRLTVRTCARALAGMQKEAVVANGPSGTAWRMVCDEGPYLNGTDLAPFPLAFFCTGMVSSFMSELVRLLEQRGISYRNIKLLQDNRYSMEGSAIAGTMTGTALPVELQLVIDSVASASTLQQALLDAVSVSPCGALLAGTSASQFTLRHNGTMTEPLRVEKSSLPAPGLPSGFDILAPATNYAFAEDIITKNKAAASQSGVPGGTGTSLADSQKRTLHMRGECSIRTDGLKEISVELFQPLGSSFRFLADDSCAFGGQERAPCGLAYLSAGLAFCFMTQIGRYATIRKQLLDDYQIIQDTCFGHPGASSDSDKAPAFDPVTTHVFLDSGYADDYARQVMDMSEQTCFLHAACRQAVRVKLKEPRGSIPDVR